MSGHRRISDDLAFELTNRNRFNHLAFLIEYNRDLHREKVQAVRFYATKFGTAHRTIRVLMRSYHERIEDLDNQAVTENRVRKRSAKGPRRVREGSTSLEQEQEQEQEKISSRSSKKQKTDPPEELSREQKDALIAWCRKKLPHWEPDLPVLVEACLNWHRKEGKRCVDWVAACQFWIRNHEKWNPELAEEAKGRLLDRKIRSRRLNGSSGNDLPSLSASDRLRSQQVFSS